MPILCGYHGGGDQLLTPEEISRIAAVHDRSWSPTESYRSQLIRWTTRPSRLRRAFTPFDFIKAGSHSR
jgi:hypothetical protein